MHTAICTFDDRASAQTAVDRLLQAGYDRNDVHLQYRFADGTPADDEANDAWDGMEREVAVDRKLVERFGHFFGRLFGHDDAAGHSGTYSRAVERGHCVVVVDAATETEAQRAQSILHGMEAGDVNVVHRPSQLPLREIIAARQATSVEQGGATPRVETDMTRERAMASQGWGEQRTLEVRDQPDDPAHAPGLRYASDKDKPNG